MGKYQYSEYVKYALEVRKKVSKLTLEHQRQVLKLYEDSIEELANKAADSKDKSLTKRWALDYLKQLEKVKKELQREIFYETLGAIGKAAKLGSETIERIMAVIFTRAGIDSGDHFTTMFSQVQKGVTEDILSGGIYYDNKTLSRRIWDATDKFKGDVQYIVNRGILKKKSALELARDLEKFVEDPAKRPWSWGRVYPNLRGTKVDYNAQRLARTAINHSYQTASIKSSSMNPFVEGMEWYSAQIHGRTCELCFERHGQVFPIDDVPLDHPNGLCTMIPVLRKSLDDVAEELSNWLDGASNPKLDDWYNEYGEYFAFRKL
jgi:hypothetical protein